MLLFWSNCPESASDLALTCPIVRAKSLANGINVSTVGQTVSHYRLLRRIGGGGMSILLILVVLTVVSVGSKQLVLAQQPHVVPLKKLSRLSMDKRYETVSGDPTKAGMPFVIRIHAEAGYIIMPHTHPEDENIVMVKGSGLSAWATVSAVALSNPWRSAI